jgi:hypothetical protein
MKYSGTLHIGDNMGIDEDGLENYFNENNWFIFSECFKNIKTINTGKILEKLGGNIELTEVIEGVVGNVAMDWINRKIPALNDVAPVDCINDEKLIKRLKVMLMRMQ